MAAALVSDMGLSTAAKKLAASCKPDTKELEEHDAFGLTNLSILLSFVELTSGEIDKGIKVLNDVITKTENKQDLGVGLASAILALYYLEHKNPKEAHEVLKRAEEDGLGEDENVAGLLALHALASNALIDKDKMKKWSALASRSAHPIIKKRVDSKVVPHFK